MWNIVFLITGLIFDIILLLSFFSREVINTKENQLFKMLSITNTFGYITEVILQLIVRRNGAKDIMSLIFGKIYLVEIFLWFGLFSIYAFTISLNRKDNEKFIKRVKKIDIINIMYIIFGIIVLLLLPLEIYYDNIIMYSYGLALDVLRIFFALYMFVWIILLVSNIKHLKQKKFIPMYVILIMLIFNVILNQIDPSILVTTMVGTIICYVMYFTIENPDLRVINELQKNRILLENNMEDKSVFLFKISQDVKGPVKNISNAIRDYKDNKLTKEEIKENYERIENNVNDLIFIINDTLNVTTMDISKIRMRKSSYDSKLFFDSLKLKSENELKKLGKQELVKINYNMSSAVPDILYGDNIKLKQALTAILANAVKNTKEGYIDFEINCITRYDITRLLINITDTGCGMNIEQINDVLSQDFEFNEEEIKKLDKIDVDLKVAIKLIRILGGSINIRSHDNLGTDVNIIIDQACDNINKGSTLLNKYRSYSNGKSVLVVDDDNKELKKIVTILSKNDIESASSLFGKDAIDRVRTGERYNLIILDDEMLSDNALPVLKELKKLKKFNTPVIVMLDKEKEFIKEHYLEDGFKDYILKEQLTSEIKRIIDKYL